VFLLLSRLNLHETISWRVIVRAIPLSLNFDAELRRRPAGARILARQGTVAGFWQYQALNRSLLGAPEDIGALRHFMLAQVRNNEPLTAILVGTLNAGGDHGVVFRRVTANDDHQSGVLDVFDGTRVSSVANGSKQTFRGMRLAVS
jgi:hypothetical protein